MSAPGTLVWYCMAPQHWEAGIYIAKKRNGREWELRVKTPADPTQSTVIYNAIPSLEDVKKTAQGLADARAEDEPTVDYPLTKVTRVELIDHRPGTASYGRALVAPDVKRVLLSFQDDNQTMKVFIA